MTGVVLLAVICGVGLVGMLWGLRTATPSLTGALDAWERTDRTLVSQPTLASMGEIGRMTLEACKKAGWSEGPFVGDLRCDLAITDRTFDTLVGQVVVAGAAGILVPPVSWLALTALGVAAPVAAVLIAMFLVPAATISLLVVRLRGAAGERRRHLRAVVASFADLVVMGLAGGVGVDGAVVAAAQVSPAWGARRIASVLLAARESGSPPWTALAGLGGELGVPELTELAAVVQLAGTEGTRIRQALEARSSAMRRHAQAEAESAANAMTERLFVPGALLLLGFLLFIGYPAFQRIIGGFV